MASNISDSCEYGLEVLDFGTTFRCARPGPEEITQCKIEWPCEARAFWKELDPLKDFSSGLLFYGTILIVIFGTLLNSLSFYILFSSGLSKNGSGVYLLTLCVCDTCNLIANYCLGILRAHVPFFDDFFMNNEILCRCHGVLVEVFQAISAWIVVVFTIERCLAVWFPMLFRSNRLHRSKCFVFAITLILSAAAMYKLFITAFEKDSVFGYQPCPSNRIQWEGAVYLSVAVQTWIPTLLVFTFNALMFYKLKILSKKRSFMARNSSSKSEPAKPRKPAVTQRSGMESHGRINSFFARASPATPMLIAVSLSYLVLVLPLGTVQTLELYWSANRAPIATEGPAKHNYVQWLLRRILARCLRKFFFGFYQMNFAINFFLYFATGRRFRSHLKYKIKSVQIYVLSLFGIVSSRDLTQRQSSRAISGTQSSGPIPATQMPRKNTKLPTVAEVQDTESNEIEIVSSHGIKYKCRETYHGIECCEVADA